MDILITNELINCLLISMMVSIINMIMIQKFKELTCIKNNDQIFILNLLLSFIIGIDLAFDNLNQQHIFHRS